MVFVRKWIARFFVLPAKASQQQPSVSATYAKQKELGDIHLRGGDFATAVQCYRHAVELEPQNSKAHCNLGFALKEQGQFKDARQCLIHALSIDPINVDAYYLLGVTCQADDQLEMALEYFRKALNIAPDFETAYLDACLLLVQLGQMEEAKQLMLDGSRRNPSYPNLHFYLGNIYNELGQLDLALASFQQTLLLQPEHAQALGNIGIVLLKKNEAGAAIDAFQQAIALDQQYFDAYNNLGNALLQFNRFDEAMACYQMGLVINPGSERLIYNRGLLSLLRGDFESGWRDYEYRWHQTEQTAPRNFAQPLWLNDADIAGRRILLHAEQGIGDSLQFCRYVEQVVALGAIVFLEVHPQIKSLLQLLPGVAAVLAMGETLPDFDCHCPFGSLPLAFRTNLETIPTKTPYLHVLHDRVQYWENQFHQTRQPRIGIVWAGGLLLKNDHNRSIKLDTFSQILNNGKYQFISLQKDIRTGDATLLDNLPWVNRLGPQLVDFVETAAVISNLDLVISVDTSVAHLAGALGKPVWILLPYSPDFRWLLDRSDSPWYPTARLFRQPARGDWDSVMTMLQTALDTYFAEGLSSKSLNREN